MTCLFTHFDSKEGRVLETGFCLVFFHVENLPFVTSSESSGVVKTMKDLFETFGMLLFIFAL